MSAPPLERVRVWGGDTWQRGDVGAAWLAVESQPTGAQWTAPDAAQASALLPAAQAALALSSGAPVAVLEQDGGIRLYTDEWGAPAARELVGAQGGPAALAALPPPPLVVVLRRHPTGPAGVEQSIAYVVDGIRRGRNNRFVIPWVRQVLAAANLSGPRGFPDANQVVWALFAAQKRRVAFIKDPLSGELVASAESLLCLDPRGVCMPAGDCDDQLVVLGSAAASAGVPVRLQIRQYQGRSEAHIVLQYEVEDPRYGVVWRCIDPSLDSGQCSREPFVRERIVAVFGAAADNDPQFVGLGQPPASAADSSTLGQTPGETTMPADQAAGWVSQLAGARNALARSRDRLVQNAQAYDAVRADLGLPVTDAAPATSETTTTTAGPLGSYAQTGVFTADALTARQRLVATADFLVNAIDDGLAGRRALTFSNGDLYVAALPGDPYGVVMGTNTAGGRVPMFVDPSGTTTGTIGLAPILIGAIVLGAVVVSLAATWAVARICDYMAQTHHDDALNKIASEQTQLVAGGQQTPDQAAATIHALTDLDKANPKPPSPLGDVLAAFPVLSIVGAALAGAALGFGLSRFFSTFTFFGKRSRAESPRHGSYYCARRMRAASPRGRRRSARQSGRTRSSRRLRAPRGWYGNATAAERTRWDKLHADYETKYEAASALESQLRIKYGDRNWLTWASRGERSRLERLEAARDKVGDKIVALLYQVSPRGEDWATGAPAWWIRQKLTWEDATRPRGEPLSVVVPAPYGRTEGLKSPRRSPTRLRAAIEPRGGTKYRRAELIDGLARELVRREPAMRGYFDDAKFRVSHTAGRSDTLDDLALKALNRGLISREDFMSTTGHAPLELRRGRAA